MGVCCGVGNSGAVNMLGNAGGGMSAALRLGSGSEDISAEELVNGNSVPLLVLGTGVFTRGCNNWNNAEERVLIVGAPLTSV